MNDLNELYKEANSLSKAGQYDEATTFYQKVIDNYPETLEAKHALLNIDRLNREQKQSPYEKYQTFWRRLFAQFIDRLCFLPLSFLLGYMALNTDDYSLHVLYSPLITILFFVYSITFHAQFGQTIGKMVCNVKVLNLDETKLSFRRAFLRDSIPLGLSVISYLLLLPTLLTISSPEQAIEIGENIPSYNYGITLLNFIEMTWLFLEVGTMLTNRKRRALHDYIAGSVVVKV